jgi:ribosomal protein S18 acetylase RimI-like enzyme
MAGEGLASYAWARMAAPGEDPWDVGARRAARNEGDFSWRNAVIAEVDGAVAAGLVTYRIADEPVALHELPPVFRPLQALENRALGTQYVNVLATYPAFRRRGIARRLLAEAERRAGEGRDLSIIVASANAPARRLYADVGYRGVAEEPVVVLDDWRCDSPAWVLMIKPARR